jgi:uncharacterized Zn-binding protein involved in type VI secretion
MAAPAQIADYYANYPDPDNAATWGRRPSGVRVGSFSEAQGYFEAANGAAPEPSPVSGPPSPGSGMAAARAGDTTAHGGTIGPVTTGQAAQVWIGNQFAACQGDPHVCPMFSGPKAHGGGTITKGSATVIIGGKPAARVADLTVCTSEPGQVAAGEPSVLIGDIVGAAAPMPAETPAAPAGLEGEALPDEGEAETADPVETAAEPEPQRRKPGKSERDLREGTHWISIGLTDEAGSPVSGERYCITLPSGYEALGALDGEGRARISGIKEPGWCRISFPSLDMDAWQRGAAGGLASAADTAAPPTMDAADAPLNADGPVRGGHWHRAMRDDCISSIAFNHGLVWRTIWDHPSNAALRALRGNPNVIQAGDAVFVPNHRSKEESGSTEQHHAFVRRGEPAQIQLRIVDEDAPMAHQPWRLDVSGRQFEGVTDAEGHVDLPIVPDARRATLRVGPAEDELVYELHLGAMEPVTARSGLCARLVNLGYIEAGGRATDEDVEDALRTFQRDHGLTVSGQPDPATRARLLDAHGS